ncbi:MAG: PDZ domain-containing protein [Planctomycetes bacterium]|nr:PDZ domain-containing protein [Planctomycetota bacterium]
MIKQCLLANALLAIAVSPACVDEPKQVEAGRDYQVPYRLTNTLHTLVRAKINGKGPFNFIIDTGAPLLFVSKEAGKKLGLSTDKKGWTTLDRFELEGGVALSKVKCRVETPFQLEGMNGLGMAGAELHGIIGYTVLAHFRMEFDFTRDSMKWTRLDFDPPQPQAVGKKGDGGAGGLEFIGGLMKALGQLAGKKAEPQIIPRGYLGIEIYDCKNKVRVQSVQTDGPAARAGMAKDDAILKFQGKRVANTAQLRKLAGEVAAGQPVRLIILRDAEEKTITITTGDGL